MPAGIGAHGLPLVALVVDGAVGSGEAEEEALDDVVSAGSVAIPWPPEDDEEDSDAAGSTVVGAGLFGFSCTQSVPVKGS